MGDPGPNPSSQQRSGSGVDPGGSPAVHQRSLTGVVAVMAVGLLSFFALAEALEANLLPALFPSKTPDLFIIRAGVVIALRGESPYDADKVQAMVAEQFPTDAKLIANSGFFRPPATIPILAPVAILPYPAAKVLWAIGVILSATAMLFLLRTFGTRWPIGGVEQLLPAILLLNYLTLVVLELGQTSFLFVGCVAAGQWCFERGRATTGTFLWAVPFIKPHLALPLLVLAWYLGGWKRAMALVAAVFASNVVGCLMVGRSPLFLWDYLQFLGSGHTAVVFNRAELNPTITSWNRLLFATGGPLVEQTAGITLAGYLVWFGLVAGRVAITGARPSPAWGAAAAAVGGVLCAQVLSYELLFLSLVVPWVRNLFADGYRLHGWLAVGLLCLELVPVKTMVDFGIVFHNALGVALLAVLVLVGPVGCSSRPDG